VYNGIILPTLPPNVLPSSAALECCMLNDCQLLEMGSVA
jgi:hypothetical protein